MRVYQLAVGATNLDGLELVERPTPAPGPGQVLVRLRAASLNYRDQAVLDGSHRAPPAAARPLVPLSDAAGEVAAVGPGVSAFKPGDRVVNAFAQVPADGPGDAAPSPLGSPQDGVLAEYRLFHAQGLLPVPAHLSFEEAATLPCAGVTAWRALMATGRPVGPGDTVLALGTGGVSIFALQFARLAGAEVIVTSSSDAKIARAQAMGARAGVNYRTTPDWAAEVARLTEGRGADCVVEVGGAGTLPRSYQAVGRGGKICLIGVLARGDGDLNPWPLMMKSASLHGISVGDVAMFRAMNRAIAAAGLRPVVDRVFPFEQAADAYRHQASPALFGKVAIAL